jgi:hypothetical protein
MGRVVAAFFLAPLLGVLVVGAITRTLDVGLLAAMVAYPIALIVGAPIFFLFKWRGWFRWWQVTLGGMACSLPFIAFYLFMAEPTHVANAGFMNSLYLLGCGAAIGITFWALGVSGNSALTARSTRTRGTVHEPYSANR